MQFSRKELLACTSAVVCFIPLLNAQEVTFEKQQFPISPSMWTVQGDFNKDGKPDFLNGRGNGDLFIVLSNPDGSYGPESVIHTDYANARPQAVGDFDRDGNLDAVVGAGEPTGDTARLTILFGNGQGAFTPKNVTAKSAVRLAVAADFNGDKKLDILAVTNTDFEFFYGDGFGNFSSPHVRRSGSASELVTGDFDGDGKRDIAFSAVTEPTLHNFQTTVTVGYGNGTGGFTFKPVFTGDNILESLVAAPVNRDGRSDLLGLFPVNDPHTGILALYGQANRTFVQRNVQATFGEGALTLGPRFGSNPVIAVADLNRDTFPDISYLSTLSGNGTTSLSVTTLLGDATGTSFRSRSTFTVKEDDVPTAPVLLTGDYNKDGKQDLALTHSEQTGPTTFESFLDILLNTTSVEGCAAPASAGVNVCTPANGSSVPSPVHLTAAITTQGTFTGAWVQVDGNNVFHSGSREIDTNLTIGSGTHTIAVKGWNSAGAVVRASVTVTAGP
jgi:hypothetical protein